MRTGSIISVVAALALAACTNGDQVDTTTATTTASPATTVTSSAPSTEGSAPTDEVVVYVAMGDSGNFSPGPPTGAIYQYAELLSDDLGTEIQLRNHTQGGQHASQLLSQLRTNARWRADLASADAVTLSIPIDVWVRPFQIVSGWEGLDPAECGGPEQTECLQDALALYTTHTDEILDELTAICDPDEVMIRMWNTYMLNIGYKLEVGSLDTINPFWQAAAEHVEQSAARYGIPVADTYSAFNGPDGTEDPYLTGLIEDDQLHPTTEGSALIAELLYDASTY